MRVRLMMAMAASILALSGAAHATPGATITVSGVWGASVTTTDLSSPNQSWSLTFSTPNPLDQGAIAGTTPIADDLVYTLGGNVVDTTVTGDPFTLLQVFDGSLSAGGGVDVLFNNTILSLYVDSSLIFNDATNAFLPVNQLAIYADVNDLNIPDGNPSDPLGDSNGTLLTITGTDVPPPVGTPLPGVPEPASWVLMIGGFGMVGAALRRRTVHAV